VVAKINIIVVGLCKQKVLLQYKIQRAYL